MASARIRTTALALAALSLAACRGDRLLRVETVPPGATVRLDDKVVGRTPADIEFEHYGRRRLSIYRPGYRTHTESLKIRSPWWTRFPFDIVSEILLPFGWDDVHVRKIALVPDTGEEAAPATGQFIENALRARSGDPMLDEDEDADSDG